MDIAGPLPFSSPWNGWKPLPGTPINWMHPLANGLVGCWVFNEGGGLPIDQVTRATSVALNTAQKWVADSDGPAWTFTSGQGWLSSGNALKNMSFSQGTIVQKLRQQAPPSGSNAAGQGYWGVFTNAAAGPHLTMKYQSITDPGFLAGWIGPTGTDYRVTATGIASTTTQSLYFFNWDTSVGSNLYRCATLIDVGTNLRNQVILAGTNATPPVVSNINASFGINGVVQTTGTVIYNNPMGNPMIFIYVYNRVLSAMEMQMLAADNYCFFQPPKKIWARTADIVKAGIVVGV